MNASGTFEVSLSPQPYHADGIGGAKTNKVAIEKILTAT